MLGVDEVFCWVLSVGEVVVRGCWMFNVRC